MPAPKPDAAQLRKLVERRQAEEADHRVWRMPPQFAYQLQQLPPEAALALELQHVVHADGEQDHVERLRRQLGHHLATHASCTGADHPRRVPVDLARQAAGHEACDVDHRRALDATRTHAGDDRIADREEAQRLATPDPARAGTRRGYERQGMPAQRERLRQQHREERVHDRAADELVAELDDRKRPWRRRVIHGAARRSSAS
jgi:hypothetical protein